MQLKLICVLSSQSPTLFLFFANTCAYRYISLISSFFSLKRTTIFFMFKKNILRTIRIYVDRKYVNTITISQTLVNVTNFRKYSQIYGKYRPEKEEFAF